MEKNQIVIEESVVPEDELGRLYVENQLDECMTRLIADFAPMKTNVNWNATSFLARNHTEPRKLHKCDRD
jgi:hypothetical protein